MQGIDSGEISAGNSERIFGAIPEASTEEKNFKSYWGTSRESSGRTSRKISWELSERISVLLRKKNNNHGPLSW